MTYIESLPKEIFIEILRFLDDASLASSARVCKSWNNMINSLYRKDLIEPRAKRYISSFFKELDKQKDMAQIDSVLVAREIHNYRNSTVLDTLDNVTDKIGVQLCKRFHLTFDPAKNRNGFLKTLDFHQIMMIFLLPFSFLL